MVISPQVLRVMLLLIPPHPPPLSGSVTVEYETCKAITVGKYRIDGVTGIGNGDKKRHLVAFYEAAIPIFEKKERSNRLMVREKLGMGVNEGYVGKGGSTERFTCGGSRKG